MEPATGPAVGARFEGDNIAKAGPMTLKKWTTTSEITQCTPNQVFEFVAEGFTTWRYEYHPGYGSRKYDKAEVPLRGIHVQQGRRGVALELPLKAGFMYQLTLALKGEGGEPLANKTAWYTLNRLRR